MGVTERAPIFAPWAAAEALGQTAAELAAFQDEPPQMASGAVGKTGFLRLGFERRGEQTILADLEWRAPCMAQRALVPRPGDAGPGLAVHDHDLGLRAAGRPARARRDACPGCARACHHPVGDQGALDGRQLRGADAIDRTGRRRLPRIAARAADPAPAARFLSDTRISIAPSATLLCAEIVQPGRKHHHPDECFGATLLSLAVGAARPDGRTLFTEKLVIDPARRPMRQTGVMDSFDVLGNVILLTPKDAADRVHARVDAEVDTANGVAFGACSLPNDAGLVFKVLGRETAQVKAKVRQFWGIARQEITGAAIPPPFFWR